MKSKVVFILSTLNDENVCIPIIEALKDKADALVIYDETQNISIPVNLTFMVKKLGDYKYRNVSCILTEEAPQLLVLANDSAVVSRMFIFSAAKFDIPTVYIPAGIHSPILRKRREVINTLLGIIFSKQFPRNVQLVLRSKLISYFIKIAWFNLRHRYYGGHGGCSFICVRGENNKNFLTKQGIKPESIIVTGDPQLDAINHLKTQNRRKNITKQLEVEGNLKIVLLLTQAFVEDKSWSVKQRHFYISNVLSAIKRIDECTPVIKLHPKESIQVYQELLREMSFDHVPILKRELPLYELISACDLVIGVNSTTLLMAMLFDKPVIVANFFKGSDYAGYIASGATLVAENSHELSMAIQMVLHSDEVKKKLTENRAKFIYENAYLTDGKASQRIANLIMKIVEDPKCNPV